jgi:3-oxoacyl-[acyl-carrier protein] reductase|tara:strand:- start:24 stop:788 length:765 start_codon:yes stop_codon:yes gene_type:complete
MDLSELGIWPGIAGRVALVTGASRGIGQAIAQGLGFQGAYVIGTATTLAGAENISKRLSDEGIAGQGMVLNVTDSSSVGSMFAQLAEQRKTPTILVNNAGITRDNLLLRMKEEEWEEVLSTNLSSLYRVCKASLRGMMKNRSGRIINITSVVGLIGNPGQSNYAAAKAGMIGFSRSLAKEVASRNITVNSIAPGYIETDMTAEIDEAQKKTLRAKIPSGRLGVATDIAAAVIFLASDGGAYITGETLNINGGLA